MESNKSEVHVCYLSLHLYTVSKTTLNVWHKLNNTCIPLLKSGFECSTFTCNNMDWFYFISNIIISKGLNAFSIAA